MRKLPIGIPQMRKAVIPVTGQLPEMFRRATFDRAQLSDDEREVPIVFATNAPCPRWFGMERLICTPDACDISRTAEFGAFLSEHDRAQPLGIIVPGSVSFTGDKALCKLRFSKTRPLALQEWADLKDGIRGFFSVGYVVHDLILREQTDTEEIYDAVQWEVLEVSLVAVPADINCTPSRSQGEKELTFPVKVTTSERVNPTDQDNNMLRRSYFSRFMAPPTEGSGGGGAGSGGGGGVQNPPAPVPNNADQTRERERVKELGNLGMRYGCMEKMGEFIDNGATVEEGFRYIVDNGLHTRSQKPGAPKPILTGPMPGDGNGNARSGGGGGEAPQLVSLGVALVSSKAFQDTFPVTEVKGQLAPNQKCGIVFDAREVGERAQMTGERATLITSAVPAGWATDRLPGIVDLRQQRLTIADLLLPGTTTSNAIEYMQEQTYANAAAMVAEGGLKPEATFTLTSTTANVRKCAVTGKISDEMITDYPYVQSFVDGRLRFMVQEKEEGQLLAGDGVAPNILGLLNQPTIQTTPLGGDTIADAIHKAITLIRVNAHTEPSGAVMHPTDWQYIALAKDANGQYYAGGPFFAPYGQGGYTSATRIWGLPVVITTAISVGTALVGAFQEAQIFRRQGITAEVTNSNEDDFKKNLIAIRAEERFALCVYRPNAFCTVTGIIAPP